MHFWTSLDVSDAFAGHDPKAGVCLPLSRPTRRLNVRHEPRGLVVVDVALHSNNAMIDRS